MTVNSAIVSPNVGEELRIYAHEREEEMRNRVAEYKRRKEEEYRKFSDESSREIEMIEFLANSDPSHVDIILRSIDDLIDKFRGIIDSNHESSNNMDLANLIRESEESRRENLEMVKEVVNERVSEFLFQKKNEIVGKYDRLKRVVDEMRDDDFRWIDEIGDRNRWEKILNEIDIAHSELSRAANLSTSAKIEMERDIKSSCDLILRKETEKVQDEIREKITSLKFDLESDIKFRARKIDSIRRRTLIAVEKRIWDIQQGVLERRQRAVAEVVAEYREELTRIFSRYLDELGGNVDDVKLSDSPRIDFETLWNRRSPASLAYRVKFIQNFLERFGGDPALARQLHNVLTQH